MSSSHVARISAAIGAVLAALLLFGPAAQAATPAPGYERFAGCPGPEEHSEIEACFRNVITGGHFQMGSKDVPISNPITLSGGITFDGHVVANSKGGLVPVKQQVPGGIIGLTGLDWLVNFLGIESLKLYAVTELAGAPSPPSLVAPFKLPVRVHLINPILGNNCYVGTFASPVNLNLTFGTTSPPPPNSPISGTPPTLGFEPEQEILTGDNGVLVDNAFSAPGASGCVLTLFGFIPISINGLVNSQSGLPAAAGTNETVQEVDSEFTGQANVYP